jgi:hypothetical protein
LTCRMLILGVLLLAVAVRAQTPTPPGDLTPAPQVHLDPNHPKKPTNLPNAPSAVAASQGNVVEIAQASFKKTGDGVPPCNALRAMRMIRFDPNKPGEAPSPCTELIYPFQFFLGTKLIIPLTWEQKGYLAVHNWSDPANILTIVGISSINIAADSHTAYGPGIQGFATAAGVSLLQDATGEFFGTFLIPSLVRQDPRYYRMPKASIPRRFAHAVMMTYVAHGDDGHLMPAYGTLLAYPISAEIGNLYVPGIESDLASTAKRVATGLAIEPANNLLTEFLPDVASRVHIFVQSILNNIAANPSVSP